MDWDDAYANGPHIVGAEDYPPRWQAAAASFRQRVPPEVLQYGPGPRNVLDLFRPTGTALGLAVFVHGGYWMAFDGRTWSHLAEGALARGWAVAVPTYTLCPDIRIGGITREVAAALGSAAAMVPGPVRLAGHSAGGHLVTRMACDDAPLDAGLGRRIAAVLSISGVHDLRPLCRTAMNRTLAIDAQEAAAESPALSVPRPETRLTCWVGADERPEFVRQNALLASIWTGLGADTRAVEEPGRHHFDVIDALADPNSAMVAAWLEWEG